jgi:hypothetical protein
MPRYKDDPPGPTKVTHIRVEDHVMERVRKSQKEGIHATKSEAAFLGYLINIGINVYERGILPLERGDSGAVALTGESVPPQKNVVTPVEQAMFEQFKQRKKPPKTG